MFTGIIETTGTIQAIRKEGSNIHFTIHSSISPELKIDQSVAHNGVCLTVVEQKENTHTVIAIQETLNKTNLIDWSEGTLVNLERAMRVGDRLDGHMVQGHVDDIGECIRVDEHDGSWEFSFSFKSKHSNLLVNKGSICINGVSLTIVEANKDNFSVAIIPYTYEHTNFKQLKAGKKVNLEFDIIGKYLAKGIAPYQS